MAESISAAVGCVPRGSDLKLEMTTSVSVPERAEPNVALNAPDEMQRALMGITIPELPGRTTTKNGRAADIVNVALLGTATQMNAAFRAAGWKNGDAMSMRSVMKQAHAFFSFNNYATAPITTQLLCGQRVDTTRQPPIRAVLHVPALEHLALLQPALRRPDHLTTAPVAPARARSGGVLGVLGERLQTGLAIDGALE
jgi:hypothetical protein